MKSKLSKNVWLNQKENQGSVITIHHTFFKMNPSIFNFIIFLFF